MDKLTVSGPEQETLQRQEEVIVALRLTASSIAQWLNAARTDILIFLLLAGAGCFASLAGSSRLDPVLFNYHTRDLWFDADIAKTSLLMTNRMVDQHATTRKHPLLSLITYPPTYLMKKTLGVDPRTAVRMVTAAIAAIWICSLFGVLRLIGCRRFDSVVFTLLGASSASAMFFLVIPDSFALGSITILWAVGLAALAQRRALAPAWYVIVSALSLSATVTNWMAGIAATIVHHNWKRSLQITVNALVVVTLGWAAQKLIFPSAEFFLPWGERQGGVFILSPETSPLYALKSFALDSIIMPSIEISSWADGGWYFPVMTIFRSAPGSASWLGSIGVFVWALLLGLGLWSLFFLGRQARFRVTLGLILCGQLGLHLVFGIELFLFSLHFVPLLLLTAALATFTSARNVALILAGAIVVLAGINNAMQFAKAAEFVRSRVTEDYRVGVAKASRPMDPFPRNSGHVVLAWPGSRDIDKAYHEPGGSFSPAVGSFGVSIWITNKQGQILVASEKIPLDQLRQQLVWNEANKIPAIFTETALYRATWSSIGAGRWRLNLRLPPASDMDAVLVIRSVGPAGGPIRSLDWNAGRLSVNGRWSIAPNTAPAEIQIGHEASKEWKTNRSGQKSWNGDDGWGYARLTMPAVQEWEAVFEDSERVAPATLNYSTTRSSLDLTLPDARFATSLNAQVAHLMMGLVGREARPGDPVAFPFAWLRDQAYIVTALARAGQLNLASELAADLASNDFFGGFGPQADEPGIAIWALEEVAVRLGQVKYDLQLWPHIQRKADLILQMLSPDRPTFVPAIRAVVPTRMKDPELTRVSEPSRGGLIVGTKSSHKTFMHVNAISYRGLLSAAELAARMNRPDEAKRYRAAAASMKDAWVRASSAQKPDGFAPGSIGRVPNWLADSETPVFFSGKAESPKPVRRGRQYPMSDNHFDLAEAHRQLFVPRTDLVWANLERFWREQESPGLYTWGENGGEEATYDLWEKVRGWTNRSRITPHYLAAAEMLLLQLDMLAYLDNTAAEPALVIGAGIPPGWLDRPMSARRLSVRDGEIDWDWNEKEMRVKVRGSRFGVRLGPSFAASTPLHVEYISSKHGGGRNSRVATANR